MTSVEITRTHLCILLPEEFRYVGTPILGEGISFARRILNLKVDDNPGGRKNNFPSPAETLSGYARRQNWNEPTIGFMTAASMESYAATSLTREGLRIETHLTSGLANARSAGDPADFPDIAAEKLPAGTINTVIIVNHPLSVPAAIEALMLAAAARARVLMEEGVRSRISEKPATGTGTDSTVILCPQPGAGDGGLISFAGMHTVTGELVGLTVMEALRKSLAVQKGA